jgi:hypothetical protein
MIAKTYQRRATLIFTLLAGVVLYNHFFFNPSPQPSVPMDELSSLQKGALDGIQAMSKLLLTLSTALFGFIGLVVFKQSNFELSNYRVKLQIILMVAFTVLSIDYGFILLEKLTEQLANELFNPFELMISFPQIMQFVMFLVALLISARLFISILSTKS